MHNMLSADMKVPSRQFLNLLWHISQRSMFDLTYFHEKYLSVTAGKTTNIKWFWNDLSLSVFGDIYFAISLLQTSNIWTVLLFWVK